VLLWAGHGNHHMEMRPNIIQMRELLWNLLIAQIPAHSLVVVTDWYNADLTAYLSSSITFFFAAFLISVKAGHHTVQKLLSSPLQLKIKD
jgi:hypothetical protein